MTWSANSLDMKGLEIRDFVCDKLIDRATAVAECKSANAVQVLGDNLLSLIKAYSYRNIPLHVVKHITKQVWHRLPISSLYNTEH